MTKPASKLTGRERRFLALVSKGTVAVGLTVGERLYVRGLLKIERTKRYAITPEGVALIRQYPEGSHLLGGV